MSLIRDTLKKLQPESGEEGVGAAVPSDQEGAATYLGLAEQAARLRTKLDAVRANAAVGRTCSTALVETTEQNEQLSQALAQRDEALDAATREIAQLKEVVAKLYDELEQFRKGDEHEAAAERTRAVELDATQAELENARGQLAAARLLSGKVDELKESLEAQRTRAGDLERKLRENEARLAGAEDLASKVRELDALLEAERSRAERLEEELQTSEARREELDGVAGQLAAERARAELLDEELRDPTPQAGEAAGLAERVDELRGRLAVERARAENLQEELGKMEEVQKQAGEEMTRQLGLAAAEAKQAHDEAESLRAEIALLRKAGAAAAEPVDSRDIEARTVDEEGNRMRLGEILVDTGIISTGQLEEALAQQQESPHRRLGSVLVDLGLTNEDVVAQVLARQLGLPFVRLTEDAVDAEAVRAIPAHLARRLTCIPIEAGPGRVVIAMANPLDLVAIDDVERASDKAVALAVAAASDIEKAIARTCKEDTAC